MRASRLSFLLSALLTLLGVHATHSTRAETFIDLTADLELTSWGNSAYDNPAMFKSTLSKIRCVVGANSWFISTSNQTGLTYTWSYTGSNLVRQIPTDDPAKPKTITTDFDGDPNSLQNAEFIAPEVRLAWLAFCSGPYLSRPVKQIPLPGLFKWLLPSDYISPPGGLQNDVVQFQDDLGLPISIDVLSKARQPVFQYRTLQGPIASPATTNIGDWHFPLEFRALQYGRNRKATNNWQSDFIARGKLTSIKLGAAPQLSINKTPRARRTPRRNSYVIRAGGPHVYNELTSSPALNKATITLNKRQDSPDRIYFTITNSEPDEILIWNVRVQVKSFAESPGTDGFGWDTVYDDYPEAREAVLKPGQSTELPIRPPDNPMWRVCVLYCIDQKTNPKTYAGDREIISQPIDDATLDDLPSRR